MANIFLTFYYSANDDINRSSIYGLNWISVYPIFHWPFPAPGDIKSNMSGRIWFINP